MAFVSDNDIYYQLETIGFIPILTLQDTTHVSSIVEALKKGNIPCVEITFRSEYAVSAITHVAQHHPDIILGAGTVLSVDQAKASIDAGARFIVTPGFNPSVIEYCLKHHIAIIPGTTGGAFLDSAIEYGLSVVKFFPAAQLGGLSAIESLASVYPVRFIPTGGITLQNIAHYIRSPHILAVGGTFATSPTLIRTEAFDEITILARSIIEYILELSLVHVGMNARGGEDALKIAQALNTLLGKNIREVAHVSHFVGTEYEIMHNGLGTHGHLAFGTNSMAVAMRVLQSRGYTFNQDFIKYDGNNRLYLAYLEHEIGGFACHLIQK